MLKEMLLLTLKPHLLKTDMKQKQKAILRPHNLVGSWYFMSSSIAPETWFINGVQPCFLFIVIKPLPSWRTNLRPYCLAAARPCCPKADSDKGYLMTNETSDFLWCSPRSAHCLPGAPMARRPILLSLACMAAQQVELLCLLNRSGKLDWACM